MSRSSRAALCGLCIGVLLPGPAWALGLLEKADPTVERGNQAYREGHYEEALQAYEEAAKEKPDSAPLQFDRGNALLKLGKKDEARDAYERALSGADQELKARDYYNLGNALAELGQDPAAARAYRKALALDPRDPNARHNLEVVLSRKDRKPPPQSAPDGGKGNDGGSPDAGPDGGQGDAGLDGGPPRGPDGGADGGTGNDGGSPDGGGGGDGGSPDGGRSDGGGPGDGGSPSDGGHPADGGQGGGQGQGGADGGGEDGGAPEPEQMASAGKDGGADDARRRPIDKQEAERILDAMRRNEKNLQLWKFKPKNAVKRPNDVDKTW